MSAPAVNRGRCPRCHATAMSPWQPLDANRNVQASLNILTGNTHKSACADCGAVEHASFGIVYAHGTGFRRVA